MALTPNKVIEVITQGPQGPKGDAGFPFTGSAEVSGSLIVEGNISASAFFGDGSGLTGVATDTGSFIVTASATPSSYTTRYTKGDGTFFDVTLNAPSPSPPPVIDNLLADANILSNRYLSFTRDDGSFKSLDMLTLGFVRNIAITTTGLKPPTVPPTLPTTLEITKGDGTSILQSLSDLKYIFTASLSDNVITFTQVDGNQFDLTIEADSFPYTGSAIISGGLEVTGSISSIDTVTAVTGSFSHLKGNSPITVQDPITFQSDITASSVSASIYYGDGSNLIGIETDPFPYTGSAEIIGSLGVTGSTYLLNTGNNDSQLKLRDSSNPESIIGSLEITHDGGGVVTYKSNRSAPYASHIFKVYGNTTPKQVAIFAGNGLTGIGSLNYAELGAKLHIKSDNDLSNNYALKVANSSGANLFVVGNDNNVGIGIATPSARLHIDGEVIIGGGSITGPVKLKILGTGGRGGSIKASADGYGSGGLIFNANEGLNGAFKFQGNLISSPYFAYNLGTSGEPWGAVYTRLIRGRNNTAEGDLYLSSGTTSNEIQLQIAGVEYARLNNNGNFGIGTTSPQEKLEVIGNISASSYYGDGSNLTGIDSGSWGGIFTGSAEITGSLEVTGSVNIFSSSLNLNEGVINISNTSGSVITINETDYTSHNPRLNFSYDQGSTQLLLGSRFGSTVKLTYNNDPDGVKFQSVGTRAGWIEMGSGGDVDFNFKIGSFGGRNGLWLSRGAYRQPFLSNYDGMFLGIKNTKMVHFRYFDNGPDYNSLAIYTPTVFGFDAQPTSASYQLEIQVSSSNATPFVVSDGGNPLVIIDTTGSVSASTYYGDGSNLTGIDSGSWDGIFTGSASITGSLEIVGNITGSLTIEGSGSTVFEVNGSEGQLFSITDSLSGSLFAVSDVSGLPILEVFSDDRIVAGAFNNEALVISGSHTTLKDTVVSGSLEVDGTQRSNYSSMNFVYSGSNLTQVTSSFTSTQQITNINYSGSTVESIAITGSDGINKLYSITYDGNGNVSQITVS